MTVIINGTTGITSVDGSAAAPSVTGTDTDTGIVYGTNTLSLATGGTTRATVDSSGNLGLGVTPSAWNVGKTLQINSASLLGIGVETHVSANAYYNAGWKYIGTGNAGRYSFNDAGAGVHAWYTAASGTAGNAITFTQAMTLDASGNLLVGTTSTATTSGVGLKFIYDASFPYVSTVGTATTNSNVAYTLYSTGAAAYRFYVGYGGTINATSTTITAISDQRLKENIRDLDDGLASVMALKPRKFDWKEGKGQDIKNARGFIAQEFEAVFPDMIEEWRDPAPDGEEPYKAINPNLIPTLVKAIQEQQALITQLTERITALEAK